MKVFLTGVDGYIGCLLAPQLIARGHEVLALDTGYYREGWLYHDSAATAVMPQLISKDLRQITSDDLRGCDAVVHLAELSNDPLGENNPRITEAINHQGSLRLAQLAKQAGIGRFVYTSSCSVYGAGGADFVDETSATDPQTAYARCKVMVERDVAALADAEFSPVFLRNATAYGASPRMRFDIVLNNLAGHAWTRGVIAMTSDGTPWRPLVHVADICEAVCCALEAPREGIHGEIFNVGNDTGNYRVREIAEIVADVFPNCELTIGDSGGDNRSYRVDFAKITNGLPGFVCSRDARFGAEELFAVFKRIGMTQETFEFRAYTRLHALNHLQQTEQIDSEFFWRC